MIDKPWLGVLNSWIKFNESGKMRHSDGRELIMPSIDFISLQVIEEEIENTLDSYRQGYYKSTFSIPEFNQELLSSVLRTFANTYKPLSIKQRLPHRSLAVLPVD
ncbi:MULTISPECIES: hypothetical protein [unclassified Coleofasciculus]|uniref:hypothetical protein n=1 Tax=unclassified Coleofasciculus TaxID=2692782 RepID=UPI00187E4DF3|nr:MULTISPECIES: hypothetical protein [unclassified Coleofasciculus]MBE9127058.1 hypothetical protein [Coleofasciculus sp. LEGE 07081]MBE9150446.1 hypothetical protein [Coleofasciculus sp. LEGE 07092]